MDNHIYQLMLRMYKEEKELWLYRIREHGGVTEFNRGRLIGRLESCYIFGMMTDEEYEQERLEILNA